MTDAENRLPPTRKATLLLLTSGVVAIIVTLGIDIPGLFQRLLGQ